MTFTKWMKKKNKKHNFFLLNIRHKPCKACTNYFSKKKKKRKILSAFILTFLGGKGGCSGLRGGKGEEDSFRNFVLGLERVDDLSRARGDRRLSASSHPTFFAPSTSVPYRREKNFGWLVFQFSLVIYWEITMTSQGLIDREVILPCFIDT